MKKKDSTTFKSICDGCGEGMEVKGGRECKYCGEEYCSDCIVDHEENCRNPQEIEVAKKPICS